jgi:hypothetical protein
MAARKTNNREIYEKITLDEPPARGKPTALIFWVAFFIIVTGLFLVNRDLIRDTLEDTQILNRLSGQNPDAYYDNTRNTSESASADADAETPEVTTVRIPVPNNARAMIPAPQGVAVPVTPAPPAAQTTTPAPAAEPPVAASVPMATPAAAPRTTPAAQTSRQTPAPATRERALYFTQIDSAGAILRIKVTRQFPVSDSPLVDSLQALLSGPTADEQRRGIASLIPRGSRILMAQVRGSTAYISFSEDFQYNTYGVEGYAAQLKQIIWTATEFSTVQDVQFLIEGRRVDYLGEGIWIGSPLGRDSL